MNYPKRLLESTNVPDGAVLSRDEAKSLVERVVKMSKADSIQVNIGGGYSANVRFADNQLSTAGGITNFTVVIQSSFGKKHAVVTTNDTSDEALRRSVKQSEDLAKLAPDDPEAMPALPPQQYRDVNAYFVSVANLTPGDRAKASLTALEPARQAGDLATAGFLVTNAASTALGNNKGLFAYHRSTNANYTVTVRTKDGTGSGWAGGEHNDWSQLDIAGISQRAIEKAKLSRSPVAIEPGRYTVILEPQAVGDLVQLFGAYVAARTADEGRSPFSQQGGGDKIGEKIVDERGTLMADPFDPLVLDEPLDGEGVPLGKQVFVESGVLKKLYYSRFWAQKQGKAPAGAPKSFIMSGGDASVEDMIKSTERGVLVTRLWYLREVDPRTILYTGLTRDGTFLIEGGKITKALKNFRFNESPLFMLNNLETLGRPIRLAGTEAGGAVIVPAIKGRDFNFTGLSDAV